MIPNLNAPIQTITNHDNSFVFQFRRHTTMHQAIFHHTFSIIYDPNIPEHPKTTCLQAKALVVGGSQVVIIAITGIKAVGIIAVAVIAVITGIIAVGIISNMCTAGINDAGIIAWQWSSC